MSTSLRKHQSHYWFATQDVLFSKLLKKSGPLTKHHEQLISVIELARIDNLLHRHYGCVGRPKEDRHAIFRAFLSFWC